MAMELRLKALHYLGCGNGSSSRLYNTIDTLWKKLNLYCSNRKDVFELRQTIEIAQQVLCYTQNNYQLVFDVPVQKFSRKVSLSVGL